MNEGQGKNTNPQESSEAHSEMPPTEIQQPLAAQGTATSSQPIHEGRTHTTQPVDSKVDPRNLRPKTGPIVWGVLVLAFCVFTASQAVAPGSVNGTIFVIGATISLGVLLLVIGAAVIVRSAKAPRR